MKIEELTKNAVMSELSQNFLDGRELLDFDEVLNVVKDVVKNCSIPDVGHTCVPEYEVSKREILENLNMAHDNLKNQKYLNARRGIGIMIRMLEREINV